MELNKLKEEKDLKVKFIISNRLKKTKGIIQDWDHDMTLDKLVGAIDDVKRITKLERMKNYKEI